MAGEIPNYVKADVQEVTFKLKFQRFRKKTRLIFMTIFYLILEGICGFFRFFWCKKREKINGQVCLITGGANGLGRALAMEFASQGCNIAIADIVDSSATVKEISEKYNVQCSGFSCDISNLSSIEKLKTDIEKEIGPVDIVVNNAGMILVDRFLNSTVDQMARCVDVNLTSNFKVSFSLYTYDPIFF